MIDLLTTGQAATRLGLSSSRVRHLAQQGRLAGMKFGRQWLFPLKEVKRFAKIPRTVGNPTFGKSDL